MVNTIYRNGAPIGAPQGGLAAAVVAVAAVVRTEHAAIVAAAAEQNQKNDDPADIATTEVIVTHTEYLQEVFCS